MKLLLSNELITGNAFEYLQLNLSVTQEPTEAIINGERIQRLPTVEVRLGRLWQLLQTEYGVVDEVNYHRQDLKNCRQPNNLATRKFVNIFRVKYNRVQKEIEWRNQDQIRHQIPTAHEIGDVMLQNCNDNVRQFIIDR